MRPELEEVIDNAHSSIFSKLREVNKLYGIEDFPADGGRAFRNYFAGFATSVYRSMAHYIDNEPSDPWVTLNEHILAEMTWQDAVDVFGQLHYFAEGRNINLQLERRTDVEVLQQRDCGLAVMTSWIQLVYCDSEEGRVKWIRTILNEGDHAEYLQLATTNLSINLGKIFSQSVDQSIDNWCGLAFHALMDRHSIVKRPDWDEYYNSFF